MSISRHGSANAEFIYRIVSTGTAKGVSLALRSDWLTGVSFYDSEHEPLGRCLKYQVIRPQGSNRGVLVKANNFIVLFDGNQPQVTLPHFGSEPYIGPYDDGEQQLFPPGHVSVYHISQEYWTQWYEADRTVHATTATTPQMEYFFSLREM